MIALVCSSFSNVGAKVSVSFVSTKYFRIFIRFLFHMLMCFEYPSIFINKSSLVFAKELSEDGGNLLSHYTQYHRRYQA